MQEQGRIFLSAVTSEFGKARDSVAADLRARGHAATLQSDFRQGPDSDTLLRSLHDYIRDCSAVVCIVGKRSGACPPPAAAERFADMLPAEITEASYTQWEFFFGRHFHRRLYTYVANDDYEPDKGAPTGRDFPETQRKFREYLKCQGIHYTPFSDVDQLARAVLKEEVSPPAAYAKPPAAPKPIVLPYPSIGSLFKGRDEFMRRLRESLGRCGQTAIVNQALYGLGGIGKTRAAVEYAWAHADRYNAVLFVIGETPEALRRNLAALAGVLVPRLDTTDDAVRLKAALDWLQVNPGWFLILDNVDTAEAMKEAESLLRDLAGGHVVITSRLANFAAHVEPLELDVLAVDDAAAFLLERTKGRRRVAKNDDARAREVAAELGQLALALEHAAAYIAKRRQTFDQYLEDWRSNRGKALEWSDPAVTAYPRAVATTWKTSTEQLSKTGLSLLQLLAWLAPEKVPEFLLDIQVPGAESDDLHDALDDLSAYSLVMRDAEGPFFLVHRLVQDVTRRSLLDEAANRSLVQALGWISAAFSFDPADARNWPRADALAPHAQAVAEHAVAAEIPEPTALLINELGLFFNKKALHPKAEPLYRRALVINENSLGPHHPEVAISLNNLAGLLHATNRLAEAEPLYRRALAINEETHGLDHSEVATNLNNLALLLRDTGRLAEGEPLIRRALAINEKSLGANHPVVAIRLGNLAVFLRATNRLSEAEPLIRRALVINEESHGPDHHFVATDLANLAGLLRDTNRLSEAEPLFRRALAIDEKSYGPHHPEVATDLANLAGLLRARNRLADAEPLLHRALAILAQFTRATGHQHPHLEECRRGYAALLAAMGRSETETEAAINLVLNGSVR